VVLAQPMALLLLLAGWVHLWQQHPAAMGQQQQLA
jgi:hypothetical protein